MKFIVIENYSNSYRSGVKGVNPIISITFNIPKISRIFYFIKEKYIQFKYRKIVEDLKGKDSISTQRRDIARYILTHNGSDELLLKLHNRKKEA